MRALWHATDGSTLASMPLALLLSTLGVTSAAGGALYHSDSLPGSNGIAEHQSAELEWSDPVLLEAPTASWPQGPDSPAYYFGFDRKHLFGPKSGIAVGRGSTWQFSSDGGATWASQKTALSASVSSLIPIGATIPGKRSFRNLGAALGVSSPHAYYLEHPAELSLLPDGSGLAVAGSSRNVTFSGIPHPGFNYTLGTPGQYGITRAGNGKYVMQANVLWNGLPQYHSYLLRATLVYPPSYPLSH